MLSSTSSRQPMKLSHVPEQPEAVPSFSIMGQKLWPVPLSQVCSAASENTCMHGESFVSSPPQTCGACPSPSLSSKSKRQSELAGSHRTLVLHGSPSQAVVQSVEVAHAGAFTHPSSTVQYCPVGHAVSPLVGPI